MRPATALIELLDASGGVVASNVAPVQAVIDGAELVLLVECLVRIERSAVMVAERISVGRHEVEFRHPEPVKIKEADVVMFSTRIETDQWRGKGGVLTAASGAKQQLSPDQPRPPAAAYKRGWLRW